MKRKSQIALGIVLLPFVVALFIIDRVICLPLFWISNHNFKKWSDKNNEVFHSLLRFIAFSIILILYKVITWIFF